MMGIPQSFTLSLVLKISTTAEWALRRQVWLGNSRVGKAGDKTVKMEGRGPMRNIREEVRGSGSCL